MNAWPRLCAFRLVLVGVLVLATDSEAFGQSCAPDPGGMVAWWPAEGNAHDIEGSRNGTLRNGAAITAGRVGQAFSVDGADDYVLTSLDVQPAAMPATTWEAWVFPARVNFPARQSMLCGDDGGFDRCVLIEQGTSNFGVFTGTGVWQPASVTPNQWQHIAVVYTSSNILFYKNGVRFSLGSGFSGSGASVNRFTIGANPLSGFTEHYRGSIDEVRVYSGQLTQAEIQAIYNAGPGGICRTLSIDDVIVNESAGMAAFTVTNVNAANVTVTVAYATEDVTAVAGQDYTATGGTLTFPPGDFSERITVPIANDVLIEAGETFRVRLSNPIGATIADDLGVATIISDDSTLPAPGAISPGTATAPGPILATASPSFHWSPVANATRYGLYVSTSAGSAVYTNTAITTTSFTLPVTLDGGPYVWRVTAINAVGEGASSPPLHFQAPLGVPAAIAPGSAAAPGPVLETGAPRFRWSPVAGAAGYRLHVATATGAAIYTNANVAGTSFTLPAPLNTGQYRWQVSAFGALGEGGLSQPFHFQVPSAAVRAIAPGSAAAPGAVMKPSPVFSWSAVEGSTRYGLYISTANFEPVYTNVNVSGTVLAVPLRSGHYRWQVTAFTATGESALSNTLFFQVRPAPPEALSPGRSEAPGTILYESAPTFTWTAVPGATRYGLYVTVAPHGEANVVHRRTNLTGTTYKPPVPFGSGDYRWYVTAFTEVGESDASNRRRFTIVVPDAPVWTAAESFCDPSDRVPVVRLAWTGTPGASAYVVLRNGAVLATTVATTFEDRSIVARQSYLYQVQAVTEAGSFGSTPRSVAILSTICEPPPIADLVPSEVALSGTVVNPGATLEIRLTMWNRGGVGAPPSMTRLILTAGSAPVSADPILAQVVTPRISAGRSVGLTALVRLPSALSPGTYFVVAQADPARVIAQFDRSNDTARSPALGIGATPLCSLGCSARVPARVFANVPVRFAAAFAGAAMCGTPAVTWEFGDRTGDARPSASHTYDAPGRYSWTMTARGSTESCRLSGTVEVTAPPMTQVAGLVVDDAGRGIAGATVTIQRATATATATSAADGSYAIDGLASGELTATVSAPDFSTAVETMVIPGGLTFFSRNFQLARPAPEITVRSLTASTPLGTYPDGTFFLDGIEHPVELVPDVDWGAHTPDLVVFSTPRIPRDEVEAGSGAIRRTMDMGFGVGPCGTVSVTAREADGLESLPVTAPYHVMAQPWFFVPAAFPRVDEGADSFKYGMEFTLPLIAAEEIVITDDIPLVGNKAMEVEYSPPFAWEVTSDGQSLVTASYDLEPPFEFDKLDLSLSLSGGIHGSFDPERCGWDWSGRFGLSGSASVTSPPYVFMIPLGPFTVPGYAKGSLSLSAEGTIAFTLDDVKLDNFGVELVGRGTLAAGIDEIAAVEGWLELGGRYDYQSGNRDPHQLTGTIRAGGAAYVWRWRYEFVLFDRSWSKEFGGGAAARYLEPRALTLDTRRWRSNFLHEAREEESGNVTVLATNEYPQSMPDLAATDSDTTVAWLTDVPSRSAANGAAVVASTRTNGRWNERVIVDDDGTADSRPRLTATRAGTFLVWEDMRTALSDSATMEQAVAGSEISVAESAGSGNWSRPTRLTDNDYLDRSPQVRGDSLASAMAVWIANRDNNLYGSPEEPNELWFSTKTSAGWSEARRAATLPFRVTRTALSYANGRATVVMAADMDGDPMTTGDRELIALTAEDGVWSPVRRLTNDTIDDDAPSLIATAAGPQLFWLREGTVSSCLNLDVDSASVVHEPGEPGNMSAYRIATAPDGAMAIVWAEASEFDSDLHAIRYDPAAGLWGRPQQLTHDREIEKFVSAALDGEGHLLIAYDRAILARPPAAADHAALREQAPAPSDEITLLAIEPGVDLAAEALEPSDRTVLPGERVTGSVTVTNRGAVAVPAFTVEVDGDDADEGVFASVTVAEPLAPGGTRKVEWSFLAPAEVPRRLFAAVRADADDRDPSNDTAAADFGSPDLAIALARVESLGDEVLFVTRVTNAGNLASAPTTLVARGAAGTLLGTAALASVEPGQSVDTVIRAHADAPVTLVIDEKGETADSQRANNSRTVNVAKK